MNLPLNNQRFGDVIDESKTGEDIKKFSQTKQEARQWVRSLVEFTGPQPTALSSHAQPLTNFGLSLMVLRHRRRLKLETLAERCGLLPQKLLALEIGAASLAETLAALPLLARGLAVPHALLWQQLQLELAAGMDDAHSIAETPSA